MIAAPTASRDVGGRVENRCLELVSGLSIMYVFLTTGTSMLCVQSLTRPSQTTFPAERYRCGPFSRIHRGTRS